MQHAEPILSVIMPVFNEAPNLKKVIRDHVHVIQHLQGAESWELLCLDDASTDQSLSILNQLSADIPQLKILTHQNNKGINASFAGLHQAARGKFIYHTASDGQWPAENLSTLFTKLLTEQADAVIGVRENRDKVYGPWRTLLSVSFNTIPQLLYNTETHDANGIKLAKKEYFQIPVQSKSFFCEIERLMEAQHRGLKVSFTGVKFITRPGGKEKGAKLANILATLRDLIVYIFTHPPRKTSHAKKNKS